LDSTSFTTSAAGAVTVMDRVPLFPDAVPVMTAVPAATPLITPVVALTDAIVGAELLHVSVPVAMAALY
jgi:hypothetical protein